MSANRTLHADDVRARNRRQSIRTVLWWLPSILLHLFVVGLVGYFGWRKIVEDRIQEEPERPPADLSEETYEALAENIESVRLSEILRQLQALQIILHNMDVLRNEMAKNFDEFAAAEAREVEEEDLVQNLFDRTLALQDAAAAKQSGAAEAAAALAAAFRAAPADAETAAQTMDATLRESLLPAYESIAASQADAQNTLDRIANEARLVGLPETARLTEEVRQIQLQANQRQEETRHNAESSVWNLSRLPEVRKRIAEREASRERSLQDKAKAEAALERHLADAASFRQREKEAFAEIANQREAAAVANRQVKEVHAQVVEARKQRDAARAATREKGLSKEEREARAATERERDADLRRLEQGERDAKAAADGAARAQRSAEGSRADAARNAQNNERGADADRRSIENNRRRIQQLDDMLANDRRQEAELLRRAADAPDATTSAHADNLAAQRANQDKVREIKEFAKTEKMRREEMFDRDFQPREITVEDLSTLDLADSYAKARELEELVTESFKDIKALELAMQTKTDFQSAERLTDVARAVRREADAALLRTTPKTQREFDAQKQEQVETVQEAERMVDASLAMMDAAVEIVRSGDDALEAQRRNQPMELQRFALDFEQAPEPPPPEAATAAQPPPPEQRSTAADKAFFAETLSAAAAEDVSEKAKDLSELMKAVDQALAETHDADAAREAVRQLAADSRLRSPKPSDVPTLAGAESSLVPGNVVRFDGESGVPARWMHINSWYVIGPFDNPNRVNLTRKFAPESAIDLDATYIGKDGRKIRWVFTQTGNNPAIRSWDGNRLDSVLTPYGSDEYTIWYGYAEVFFDRECDLWLATGSDDRSDIWINDMHVWNSSNVLKSWSINEGFRKVHFRAGRNRVLVRLENGWHGLGYSVCLYLGDDDNPAL